MFARNQGNELINCTCNQGHKTNNFVEIEEYDLLNFTCNVYSNSFEKEIPITHVQVRFMVFIAPLNNISKLEVPGENPRPAANN